MAKVGLVYGSVCSGISSESMAWQALGWKAAWFSQFDPDHNYKSGPDFPSAVLAHHCSHIPNLGDANEIHKRSEFKESKIDILVGGTPCQTFSQAGQRQGFNDPRGRLALRFAEIAAMRQPRWIIWENVPDVVSSNGGKDFRAFLRKLHDAGYGCSWRFLDAADFGLPQSRKRIFLVGHIGGEWKRAAAVLAERRAMCGALETERDASAEGGTAGATGASAVFAIQGNAIGRNPGAGPQGIGIREGLMYCLTASDHHAVIVDGVARYITPVEAERLQGFAENYTQIPFGGKPADQCSDDPRYEALGNAIAIPVLRWIGEGIALVDPLPERRLAELLEPEDLAKGLGDSELIERCVQGFRSLKEMIPYLREARQRFARPGQRVPIAGKPTWSKWVKENLHVSVRRVQQLLRESSEPSEMISPGSNRRKPRYWLTPRNVYGPLNKEFHFDNDPCPYPRPEGYDSLLLDWGQSNYVNPPFSSDDARSGGDPGVGPTAWIKKAIEEQQKGRSSVLILPIPSYVNMVLEAGGEIRSAGRVRWLEVDTKKPSRSPFPCAVFVLRGKK